MKIYKHLYTTETTKGVTGMIIKKLGGKRPLKGYWFLTVSGDCPGLMEIKRSEDVSGKNFSDEDLAIVGMASSKEEAMLLSGSILMDIKEKTGSFDVKKFFGRE